MPESGKRQRTPEAWTQPPRADCQEIEAGGILDTNRDGWSIKIESRQWLDARHQIIDYCVEVRVHPVAVATWTTIYRADTSHGETHQHLFKPDGTSHVTAGSPLDSPSTITTEFDKVMARVESEWPQMLRRWRNDLRP